MPVLIINYFEKALVEILEPVGLSIGSRICIRMKSAVYPGGNAGQSRRGGSGVEVIGGGAGRDPTGGYGSL